MKTMVNILIILMIASVLFAGCIQNGETLKGQSLNNTRTIKYIENREPLITKADFPDFNLLEYVHFVTSDNLTVSLYTETSHGGFIVNGSEQIPEGFRVYGSSEAYNSSQGYLLLQYKVFDDNDRLNDSMNTTVFDYIRNGFLSKSLNNSKYTQRIFILESSMENINNRTTKNNINTNATNGTTNVTKMRNNIDKDKDINVTYILFGYDTVLGRIAVKDYKDKSLNESLKILDIALERLRVGTKNVSMNVSMFGNMTNMGNNASRQMVQDN